MGIMGNSDPRMAAAHRQQQASNQMGTQYSNGRSRVGLTPSEGRDAYKRSSTRSSRRSRSERTSYLMATGHLDNFDIEETRQFNAQSPQSHYQHQHHQLQQQLQQLMPNNNAQQSGDCGDSGKFKPTYADVTFPMKTSPAFEYILKDNRRRNKRCCLWLLYLALMTVCIAIIVFCSVQLALRY